MITSYHGFCRLKKRNASLPQDAHPDSDGHSPQNQERKQLNNESLALASVFTERQTRLACQPLVK